MIHGTGTTHVSLTLANYLCSKLGMKTAYIELNATNQIRALNKKQGTKVFSYREIDIFPNTSVTSLSEILGFDYRYFILDMGVLNTHTAQEFLRCDKPLLVCSPSKWKLPHIKEKIEALFSNTNTQNRVTLIMNFSKKEPHFSSFLNMRQVSFPYLENPFHVNPKHFHVFTQFF